MFYNINSDVLLVKQMLYCINSVEQYLLVVSLTVIYALIIFNEKREKTVLKR